LNDFSALQGSTRSMGYFKSPIEYVYDHRNKVGRKEVKDEPNIFSAKEADELLLSENMDKLKEFSLSDKPISSLPNPYSKPPAKCILCEHKVDLDYKNVRLLTQFVSPFTGQIYGRHITGLCTFMQSRVTRLIKRSQFFGYMPYTMKTPEYMKDPKLFDPFKRKL